MKFSISILFVVLLASGCATTAPKEKLGLDDPALAEKKARYESLVLERQCLAKMMADAKTVPQLDHIRGEITRVDQEIGRLETDVPDVILKSKEVEVTVSKEEKSIIDTKKQMLKSLRKEQELYKAMLLKSKTVEDLNTVKAKIDSLQGQIETMTEEIRGLEMEDIRQQRFKQMQRTTYWGPVGLACKTIEYTLRYLYVLSGSRQY